MREIEVGATRLPGVGWRYELPLARGTTLFVVVEERGRRHLLLARDGDDEPWVSVPLNEAQSLAVASLLSGARYSVAEQDPAEALDRPRTVVESVLVTDRSSILGMLPGTLQERLAPHGQLLGVVSDETPQILEGDPDRPIQAGDRVVLAARATHHQQVLSTMED
jgi:TrkA domain protein